MLLDNIKNFAGSLANEMFGLSGNENNNENNNENPLDLTATQYLALSVESLKAVKEEEKGKIELITKTTPNFSYPEFECYVKSVLRKLLESRQTMTLDHFSNCLSKEYYHRLCTEYLDLKNRQLINIIRRIDIKRLSIQSFNTIGGVDTINVKLYISYMDYYKSAVTGIFLRGNRYDTDDYIYSMEFIKNNNYDEKNVKSITNCPNCGAPLDEVFINVCKYCDTVVPLPDKQWLLSDCNGYRKKEKNSRYF